jgi:DNA repair exonuclease SbcCD ATPase subunit
MFVETIQQIMKPAHARRKHLASAVFALALTVALSFVIAGRDASYATGGVAQTAIADAGQQQILAEMKKTQEMVRQALRYIHLTQKLTQEMNWRHERLKDSQTALEQTRADFAQAQSQAELVAQQLRELEEELAAGAQHEKLRVMREEQSDQQQRLERHTQQSARLQQKEAQHLAEIETEKANLDSVKAQLAAIEKQLMGIR